MTAFLISPLLYEIANRFSLESSQARIQFYLVNDESCSDLFEGKADILVCPDTYYQSLASSVESEPVSEFQFSILVAEGNPLYEAQQVSVPNLLGVPLTVAHINADSPYVKRIQQIFRKYGFSPVLDHPAARESLCFEILARKGVGIATPRFWRRLDARTSEFFGSRIRVFPIEGETLPVSFVWRAGENDSDIQRFIRTFRSVMEEGNNREILDGSYQ